jgi:hypothetical protein
MLLGILEVKIMKIIRTRTLQMFEVMLPAQQHFKIFIFK